MHTKLFLTLFFAFSLKSPENQERKSKLMDHEKEKTLKSDRKRVGFVAVYHEVV